MCSKQLIKNCPKHHVIVKISRPIENEARESSNLASNFQLEVDMWPFLHVRSRKLTTND